MADFLEIIVTTEDSNQAKIIKFEELYPIKDQLKSIMLLWNAQCYYADCINNQFIINGGRRIQFPELGDCKIEYRKRTTMQMTLTGDHDTRRKHVWMIGLRNIEDQTRMLLLEISPNGAKWTWRNAL